MLITWVEYDLGICGWVVLFAGGTPMDLGSIPNATEVVRVRWTLRWWHTRGKMHGGKKKECSMAICIVSTWTFNGHSYCVHVNDRVTEATKNRSWNLKLPIPYCNCIMVVCQIWPHWLFTYRLNCIFGPSTI